MSRKHKDPSRARGLPSREEILEYLRTAAEPGAREIARAFALRGGDRVALKALLAEMAEEGLLRGNRRGFKEAGSLPPVAVLDIVGRDADGEPIGQPAVWDRADGEHQHARHRPRRRAGARRG